MEIVYLSPSQWAKHEPNALDLITLQGLKAIPKDKKLHFKQPELE